MKIHLPRGYRPPESARPGEPFEVVAVLVSSEDGSFMLKSLDGVEVGEDDESVPEIPWDEEMEIPET